MPELDDVMPITTAYNKYFISFRKTFDKCIEELEIDAGDQEYRKYIIKKYINKIEDIFEINEPEDLTQPCICNCGLTKLHCPDWIGENENEIKEKKKCCVCNKMKVWRTKCFNDAGTKLNKFWCAECINTNWT